MRFARAWAEAPPEGLGSAGFDCVFAAQALPAGVLNVAIHAIASACALFGREAELLATEAALAREYLKRSRRAAPPGDAPVSSLTAEIAAQRLIA